MTIMAFCAKYNILEYVTHYNFVTFLKKVCLDSLRYFAFFYVAKMFALIFYK